MCGAHYQRTKKHGHPLADIPIGKLLHVVCTAPDCDRDHWAKGLCKLHYSRQNSQLRRTNDQRRKKKGITSKPREQKRRTPEPKPQRIPSVTEDQRPKPLIGKPRPPKAPEPVPKPEPTPKPAEELPLHIRDPRAYMRGFLNPRKK